MFTSGFRSAALSFVVACTFIANPAIAKPVANECKWISTFDGKAHFTKNGKAWEYSVFASGPQWKYGSSDHHSTGSLICNSCGISASGRFYLFSETPFRATDKYNLPKTATERIALSQEHIGYPIKILRQPLISDPIPVNKIKVGNFSGYAVEYELTELGIKALGGYAGLKPTTYYLLAVSATDECVRFETTIFFAGSVQYGFLGVLESFLNEVTINKRRIPYVAKKAVPWRKLPRLPVLKPISKP